MKKFLLLLGMLFCAFNLSAQNYDNYLQKAYEHLKQGNINAAKQNYGVYQTMTDKNDNSFEKPL